MKIINNKLSRCIVTFLTIACLFGGVFPFLNIDLGFVILTPLRSALFLASIYCAAIWCYRLKKKEFLVRLIRDRLQWITFGFLAVWFVAGAVWIVFGDTNSYAPTEAVGILSICALAFCFFTLVDNHSDIHFFLRVIVLCGVILAGFACLEVVIGNFVPGTRYYFTLVQRIRLQQTLFSPTTVFYNPNDFAAFMLLCFTVVCFWILRSKTKRDFLICVGIAMILIIPTVLTNSTIFYILACVLVVFTVLGLLVIQGKTRRTRLIQASFVVFVAVSFSLLGIRGVRSAATALNKSYFSVQIQNYYAQAGTLSGDTDVGESIVIDPDDPLYEIDYSSIESPDSLNSQVEALSHSYGTIHVRIWLIRAGLDFFMDSPLIGCGPESFREKISQNSTYLSHTRRITNPHFFYTELLSQYGGILFGIYMGIIMYAFLHSLRLALREIRCGQPDRGLLCLMLIVFFSAAVIMPSSTIRFTSIWLFFILAVCAFSKKAPEKTSEFQP